jgi:hypothetical protein
MSVKFFRNSRRAVIASVVGLAATGGILASAAALSVNANTLGAGTSVIASCDTDGVTVSYTSAYNAAAGAYRTTAAVISGIAAACDAKSIDVTVSGAGGASLANGTGTIAAGGTHTVTFASAVDPALITGAAIVITG